MSEKPLTERTMSPEGERAKSLLKLANYARVAEVLGVSRASVARWAKGDQVTPWQLQRLQELLGHNESALPVGAGRILAGVIALERRAAISEEELAEAEAEAVLLLGRLLEADGMRLPQ